MGFGFIGFIGPLESHFRHGAQCLRFTAGHEVLLGPMVKLRFRVGFSL